MGHIPDAVAIRLKDRMHLGIHSGMFSESLMELIRCGAVDNSRKGFHPGETVTAFAAGSQELYRFLHKNRDILIKGGYYTNAPAVIAQNRNMVSLNTALEIDLTGQCAAESMGFTQWSATGAQTETVEGAQLSPGGKSILALPSCYTARSRTGERSFAPRSYFPSGRAPSSPPPGTMWITLLQNMAQPGSEVFPWTSGPKLSLPLPTRPFGTS